MSRLPARRLPNNQQTDACQGGEYSANEEDGADATAIGQHHQTLAPLRDRVDARCQLICILRTSMLLIRLPIALVWRFTCYLP